MITGFPVNVKAFIVMFDGQYFIYGDLVSMRQLDEAEVNELWQKEIEAQ